MTPNETKSDAAPSSAADRLRAQLADLRTQRSEITAGAAGHADRRAALLVDEASDDAIAAIEREAQANALDLERIDIRIGRIETGLPGAVVADEIDRNRHLVEAADRAGTAADIAKRKYPALARQIAEILMADREASSAYRAACRHHASVSSRPEFAGVQLQMPALARPSLHLEVKLPGLASEGDDGPARVYGSIWPPAPPVREAPPREPSLIERAMARPHTPPPVIYRTLGSPPRTSPGQPSYDWTSADPLGSDRG